MLCLYVNEQQLKLNSSRIVADTVNYIEATVSYKGNMWLNKAIFAHFVCGEYKYSVEVENGFISADKHLNLTEGEWEISLHGDEFDGTELKQRITTNVVRLTVEKSGAINGDPFPETESSVVEDLVAKKHTHSNYDILENIDNHINELIDDRLSKIPMAEEGEF